MAFNSYNTLPQRDPNGDQGQHRTRQSQQVQQVHQNNRNRTASMSNEITTPTTAQAHLDTQSPSGSLPLTYPEYDAQNPSIIAPPTYSNQLQFQVPFIIGDPPTIPPGGGAEAMTAMLPSPSSSSMSPHSWFVNDFIRYSPLNIDNSTSTLNPQTASFQENNGDLTPYSITQDILPSSTTDHRHIPPQADHTWPIAQSPTTFIDPNKIGIPRNIQPLLYSASGFDLLGILAKVATRPKPQIQLGPVDFTCSFCFVDVRRYDHPIIYASPTFYKLTGYSEQEIIGRNCRFLQSPEGHLERGAERKFTSPEAVQHLRKSLMANKECQASLINYRKGGHAFINLVTVIPVPGENSDEIAYHVGFQVDLTEQPNAILQRLSDGTYLVNYSSTSISPAGGSRDHNRVLSKELRYIVSQGNPSPVPKPEQDRINFNNFLLDNSEDFIHVLSLKGLFQYVSPSIRKVLEYESEELIGKSISHICHPADITPVIRELKESSSTVPAGPGAGPSAPPVPKTVNLLFRARTRRSGYVWIESHGKMHVEPGKGRKSIILIGRRRNMPRLDWQIIERAGGISEDEFWGLVSPDGLWLNVAQNVSRVIGRTPLSITGTSMLDMLPNQLHQQQVLQALYTVPRGPDPVILSVEMLGAGNSHHLVTITFYPPGEMLDPNFLAAIPIVCQVKLIDPGTPVTTIITTFPTQASSHSPTALELNVAANNLFEELDTTRHTSWQYELTNLRIANKNLLDDIAKLEIQQGLREPEIEPQSPDDGPEASSSRPKKRSRPDAEQSTDTPGV